MLTYDHLGKGYLLQGRIKEFKIVNGLYHRIMKQIDKEIQASSETNKIEFSGKSLKTNNCYLKYISH